MTTLTTDDLDRIVENVRLIEESKDRRCNMREGKLVRIDEYPECGKPATHQAFHTCCGQRVGYLCTEHADTIGQMPHACRVCKHRCYPGVCFHRIITTL